MNILFTLCGRAGSKGVKGKNIRDFCGVPLVWYSLAAIELYKEIYLSDEDCVEIVLNTDSEALISIINKVYETSVFVIHREEDLAGDVVPKVSVIKDCLNRSEVHFKQNFDVIVDLDITSPLRTVEDIKNAIYKKNSRDDTDVVYSVTNSRRNPYFNMVKEANGFFSKAISSEYTTRQQAPVFYDMNASIYVYSPKALRTKHANAFFNDHCDAIIMYDTGILDIDSEEDYELMQVVAKYLFEKDPNFNQIKKKAFTWSKDVESEAVL